MKGTACWPANVKSKICHQCKELADCAASLCFNLESFSCCAGKPPCAAIRSSCLQCTHCIQWKWERAEVPHTAFVGSPSRQDVCCSRCLFYVLKCCGRSWHFTVLCCRIRHPRFWILSSVSGFVDNELGMFTLTSWKRLRDPCLTSSSHCPIMKLHLHACIEGT